jgi:glycosyltransferase involved in cell wall biosynthesis
MSAGTDERRLRILFLPAWYPSQANPVSGTFVREHAKAAALYDDVVVLYVSTHPTSPSKEPFPDSDASEDGIRTVRVSYGARARKLLAKARRSGLRTDHGATDSHSKQRLGVLTYRLRSVGGYCLYCWRTYVALRAIRRTGWRPDIIHAHVYTAGVPAVVLGKLYRLPVVITEHSTAFPRDLVRGNDKLMARFVFAHAAVVCPVSESLKRSIEAHDVKAKYAVVPNAVDTKLFFPKQRTRGEQAPTRRLLLVALLTPKKGVPYLLEALASLRNKRDDILLDIVGDGPLRTEYEQLAHDLALRDIVSFHGMKDKSQVAEFMRNSDAFVVSSTFETFSVVTAEALATGLPVVATRCGGPEELVTAEVGLIVDPGDPQALCDAIEHVLDNLDSYPREQIARYAAQRFSRQAVGAQLHEVYARIAHS